MEEREFEERESLISAVENQTQVTRNGLTNLINNYFVESVNALISLMIERDTEFKEYIGVLKDFAYDDKLTSPSDLFPGIRTVSETVDMEELNKKTQILKDNSISISNKSQEIESLIVSVISNLSKAIELLKQLDMEERQVYDLYLNLLKDLDSIYDIGKIARST